MKSIIGDYLRMKKVFTVLFLIAVFIFNTGNIKAQDSAYKNDLLKIELTKLDENHYDIGLYTQKIYNEPVKVVKKSDTIYYLLLPETSHSITSVTPLDAIKSVMVKSYPYAGQDLDNSYTKVAIITSKPLELTTSLKTLDTSISPRLDPVRLAKLDQVFERYSQRLAENNIPSPLNDFRKTTVAQRPNLQSNVVVDNDKEIIASKPKTGTDSLEEYQNMVNQKQAAESQTKKTETTSAKKEVKQPVKQTQTTTVKKPAATKPVIAAKPVQKQVQKPVQKPAQKPKTETIRQTPAQKPVVVAQKPSAPVQKQIVQKQKPVVKTKPENVTKPVQTGATQTVKEEKPVIIAQKQADIKETIQAQQSDKKSEITPKTAESKGVPRVSDEEYEEYEKQLVVDKPIDVEFSKTAPAEILKDDGKEIKSQAVVPIEKIKVKDKTIVPQKAANDAAQKQKQNAFMLLVIAGALGVMYIMVKRKAKAKQQRTAAEFLAAQKAAKESSNIKEYLKNKQLAKLQHPTKTEEDTEEKTVSYIENNTEQQTENTLQPAYNQEMHSDIEDNVETNDKITEEEKVRAFNAYMDSLVEPDDAIEADEILYKDEEDEIKTNEIKTETEDDEVIKQLYTPIETRYTAAYPISYDTSDEAEVLSALRAQDEQNKPQTKEEAPVEDDEVATIVSSSKLTETRGLYLAKFEGTTSLVGYIQDDIYVLYNFGDVEIQDTDIQSRLAQENDTDSLYIVKTGGKKLMVKSTPYDMSLEMVM